MNYFGTVSLIISLISILFGVTLLFANSKSKVIRAWFFESISVSLWSLALFGVTTASTEKIATMWQYLLDFSAMFIPVLFYNFISIFLQRQNKKFVHASLVTAVALALLTLTPYFKSGVAIKYSFYWIVPGTLYFILPLFIGFYTLISLYLLIKTYKSKRTDLATKKQSIILFWGFLIGSLGGATNFLPQFFDIYPFGNFLTIVYFIFMAYAIIRFEFLNVKLISAQFFSIAVMVALIFSLLQSFTLQGKIASIFMLAYSVFFGILLIRSIEKEASVKEKLKELDEMKTELVSLATHHISTPLTAIKGYVSMLQEGDYGNISNDKLHVLQKLDRLTNNLTIIVRDFLDVEQIDNNKLAYSFSDFDVKNLLEKIILDHEYSLKSNNIKLNIKTKESGENTNDIIYGDSDRIKHALANILENSIKYSENSNINISLETEGTSKIITISDTGIRKLPIMSSALAKKFSKSGNEEEASIIGNGLGIYVAKQIAEAHEGTLAISADNSKTVFTLKLPIK